jgi:ankyrin repeat protein
VCLSAALTTPSQEGLTPLHLACMPKGSTEAALLLIEKGADVNAKANVRRPSASACDASADEAGAAARRSRAGR